MFILLLHPSCSLLAVGSSLLAKLTPMLAVDVCSIGFVPPPELLIKFALVWPLLQAAGSSLLAKVTALLAADALRLAGLLDLGAVTVLPLATGMAMTMTLLGIKASR